MKFLGDPKHGIPGKRILYGAPTQDQVERFWVSVTRALQEPIEAGVFYKNETKHIIERVGTEQRIRAKTCWSADTLRGDYADELLLDEFQIMNEDTWGVVGAPMLADNAGNAIFIYTPPSLHNRSVSKATDPRHASKMFKKAQADTTGRWETFNFTSYDNPHVSKLALDDLKRDMTTMAYRMEIMAEDLEEAPGALWKRADIDASRVLQAPELKRVVVGVDPSTTSGGDEAGIITAGRTGDDYYTLSDDSVQGSPDTWARAAVTAYHRHKANCIVAEDNNGGEMVEMVIKQVDPTVIVRRVHASRGKATRAEPIVAISEQGRDHHVGVFPLLEDELMLWQPGDASPNRLDGKVWAITELMKASGWSRSGA
jgi:phage terminase large subunit-like protein